MINYCEVTNDNDKYFILKKSQKLNNNYLKIIMALLFEYSFYQASKIHFPNTYYSDGMYSL